MGKTTDLNWWTPDFWTINSMRAIWGSEWRRAPLWQKGQDQSTNSRSLMGMICAIGSINSHYVLKGINSSGFIYPLKGFPIKGGMTIPNIRIIYTLSPIVMEVEHGGLEDDFSLQGRHFPLPWLWEKGCIMFGSFSMVNRMNKYSI